MYGLRAIGLPDERRLVLPDDWPEDIHQAQGRHGLSPAPDAHHRHRDLPLRQRAGSEQPTASCRSARCTSPPTNRGTFVCSSMGIIDADYRLFYVHRGMEKLAETRMGYNEVAFLTDRVCGICGFTHSVAYTTSVENAMGIPVPERAKMIRAVLLPEVERLHSHILNIGLSSHFTGFDTGFMQFFRVRRKIHDPGRAADRRPQDLRPQPHWRGTPRHLQGRSH
ncbi:nickel-dependent hydrogenase large subunit [Escherichia coli]